MKRLFVATPSLGSIQAAMAQTTFLEFATVSDKSCLFNEIVSCVNNEAIMCKAFRLAMEAQNNMPTDTTDLKLAFSRTHAVRMPRWPMAFHQHIYGCAE